MELFTAHELNCKESTQLDVALVGHARQRHDLISCGETGTVGAQSVRALAANTTENTMSQVAFTAQPHPAVPVFIYRPPDCKAVFTADELNSELQSSRTAALQPTNFVMLTRVTNKLSPRGRRDDMPPADGRSTVAYPFAANQDVMDPKIAADLRPSADGSAVRTSLVAGVG